uniref:Uncharacterized protein n=1 Tax=Avena sativa TaxID=4498 RepID=A0ACD5WG65_AVESA
MSSFQPPGVPASTTGKPCPPAWVLLNTLGYIADRDNATSRAEALTSTGHPIAFTFFPVEPPGVSHFCVHCRGLDYSTEPKVVHSADNLALLTICLKHGRDLYREYFLYRASRNGQPQSLELLMGMHDQISNLLPWAPIAVVPCGGGEQFVLAALGPRYWTGKYDFRVFRSELGTWTKKVLALGAKNAMDPKKVIVLVGGEIGWEDLLRGILVCSDLLDPDPAFRVIPLPTLLPVNRVYTGRTPRSGEQFRDVVCVDGVIKLVEIEYCRRRVVHDVSKLEVLYDQDLSQTFGDIVDMEPDTYEYTGWRLLTWSRTVSSNCWRRGSLLHVDDMTYSALLPPAGRRLLEKKNLLLPSYPILSMDSTDVVYLKCKMDPKDTKAWVVTLDIGKKTIQDVAPFPDERSRNTNFTASPLFKYLNAE